jgi:voltage-gated potassium channel
MKSITRTQGAYERFDQWTEGPMTVLAFVMLPVLVIPLIRPLHGAMASGFDAADYVIWALFAAEYGAKLYLAPDRWIYFKSPGHLFDFAIVVLPFLRPLRILRSVRGLRLLRGLRLVSFFGSGIHHARAVLRKQGLRYVLLVAVVVIFVTAGLEVAFEAHARGATIHNYGDALWWAMSTVTTVGYGDKVPVTAAGRGVAVLLMLTGIALFGVITASVASYFVGLDQDEKVDVRVEEVLQSLRRIEAHLGVATDLVSPASAHSASNSGAASASISLGNGTSTVAIQTSSND